MIKDIGVVLVYARLCSDGLALWCVVTAVSAQSGEDVWRQLDYWGVISVCL